MTDTPEAPAERVALHYTGSTSVRVPDSAHSNPYLIEPDSVVVVDAWAADDLLTRDEFKAAAGTSLDDALRAAGISTSGTADEKRTRLATHERVIEAARAIDAAAETHDQPTPDETQES